MSYITKYLESLMTKKDKLKASETTDSLYYFINGITIRVADHFSIFPGKVTIDIVNPLNDRKLYLVRVVEGPLILTFNLAGLKTFIQNYLYLAQIKSKGKEVKNNKTKVALKNKNAEEADDLPWSRYCVTLPAWKRISAKRRRVIKAYWDKHGSKATREKLEGAIKDGYFNYKKGKVPPSLREYFEGE